MPRDLVHFLQSALDSPRVVEDLTWTDGDRPTVLKVEDRRGELWIAKQHRLREQYRAELTAYHRWVDHLDGRAPSLHAADDDLMVLIIDALPGDTPRDWTRPELLREAGRILRALHEAETYPPYDDLVEDKLARLDDVAPEAQRLLEPHVLEVARAQLEALDGVAAPRRVPCHLDYSPRNWLLHAARLSVFDFGDAGPDAWINDFGRLFIGWRLAPAPKQAFLDGYGATPTADDLRILRASYTARLVSHVVFAHEHGYTQAGAACRQLLDELVQR